MEKPNFTPGPWKWEPDNWNGGYSGIVGPDGERILVPNCKNDGDDGAAWFEDFPTKPDANLIVAAPDMFEALSPLEELATQMAADAPEWDSDDSVKVYLTIEQLRRAVAALAKVRGE